MPGASSSNIFGEIHGAPVGTHFIDRRELSEARVHAGSQQGIWGSSEYGAYSIVLNGGYVDDDDMGETLIYTGAGQGRGKDGKGRRHSSFEIGPQVGDQEWVRGNAALRKSAETGRPVRVIRGPDGNEDYSPIQGYRYDGLYKVVRAWQERGKAGFLMCRFALQRLPSQRVLPRPSHPAKWWDPRTELGLSRPPITWPEKRDVMAEEKDAKKDAEMKEKQPNSQAATAPSRGPRPGIDQGTTSTVPPRNGLLKIKGRYTTFGSK